MIVRLFFKSQTNVCISRHLKWKRGKERKKKAKSFWEKSPFLFVSIKKKYIYVHYFCCQYPLFSAHKKKNLTVTEEVSFRTIKHTFDIVCSYIIEKRRLVKIYSELKINEKTLPLVFQVI